MAQLLSVLCCVSLLTAEAGFLQSRALAPGPSTSLDGSVRGKGSEGSFIQDTSFGGVRHPTSSPLHSDSDDIDKPFEKSASVATNSSPFQTPVEKPAALATASDEEEPFEVHTMLLFATREATSSSEQSHPDHHQRSDADHFGLEVTQKCVPSAAQQMWMEAFRGAVDMMLEKNLHGMQHGLLQIAHSVIELIDGTTCGFLAHNGFAKLKDQAERLHVLASAGSLNDMDVTIQYEPLKALTVGGVDIHRELNEFIIAWQFKKGPEETGRAMAAFFRVFADDSDEIDEACYVELYEHGDFTGWKAVLSLGDHNHNKLVAKGAKNDGTSSMKVIGADCQAVVYQHGDFTGWKAVFASGDYDHAAFIAKVPNDEASSIQVSWATSQADVKETRTPKFWSEVLRASMLRFGGGQELISESCLAEATTHKYGDALEDAIARMLEKTRHGMSMGIKEMAAATIDFVDGLEKHCAHASGAKQMRNAADRLRIFASAKVLAQPKHVEYEPMKVLKVGGIDVHKELNRFLAAWIHHQGAEQLANGLVDFLQDFKEQEVDDSNKDSGNVSEEHHLPINDSEPEVIAILRDAIHAGSWIDREKVLSEACLSGDMRTTFSDGIEKALDHMLQKRRRSMQLGLKELADVVVDTIKLSGESRCVYSQHVDIILKGAKKLRTLTRKTVVDYGTHIKYEAMKSLVVGGVDIHRELNEFIGAWKLRSHREAGTPLGVLMRKLAEIEGHDEL